MKNQVEVLKINRIEGDGSLKAFCDVSLFDTLVIKGFRIVNGKEGLFVGMPRRLGNDGKWYETIKLLNRDTKQVIKNIVLEAYST